MIELPPNTLVAGDPEELVSQDEFESLVPIDQLTALEFDTYADFLMFFHPGFKSGEITLYDWQQETADFISAPDYTTKEPLKFLLKACNGSGKDAYCIAPFAVWHCGCKIRSRCVITSSSYSQLYIQTQSYIRYLCSAVNSWFGKEFFVIKKDHITCPTSGSEIVMFSTDDPGKAEGYHPFPDYPNAELAIIANEAKSIPDSIFEHLRKCTYNRFLYVSSPGGMTGEFYNKALIANEYPDTYEKGGYYLRKVTAYECKHKTKEQIQAAIDELPGGEANAWFRSTYLAEFTSLDEQIVIPPELLSQTLLLPPDHMKLPEGLRAGLDFGASAGGDENVGYIVDGNKVLDKIAFRQKDPIRSAEIFAHWMDKYKTLGLRAENVQGDDGGVGRGTISALERLGWPINRVLNNSAPLLRRQQYSNRGAELYCSVLMLFQAGCLILPPADTSLKRQLESRRYGKSDANGKIRLESKKEARAKGHGSPDHADAYVLAYSGVNSDCFFGVVNEKKAENHLVDNAALLKLWASGGLKLQQEVTSGKSAYSSLSVILN